MKRFRLLMLSLVCVLSIVGLHAQTFVSDGINYTVCFSNRFNYAVYVTKPAEGKKYSGDIKIPQKVNYNNEECVVVGVGNDAFKDCTEMTSCVFEGIIEWIGNSAFEGCTGLKEFTIPSYYSDDVYQGYVYLGYRAFWGCHLQSLTCMSGIPPIYSYNNPSWQAGLSYPIGPDWIGWEMGDYWHEHNTTTLYVPVGTIRAYSEKSDDFYRDKWGDYFTIIKEWGVEEDDPVPGLYEDINALKPLCDDAIVMILWYSKAVYNELTDYIYITAEQEGGDITALQAQLDASFETITLSEGYGDGGGDFPHKVIPKHKDYIRFFQNSLSEAQKKLEKMQEKRIAYYKARGAGDSSADSKKAELATLASEEEELISGIQNSLAAFDWDAIMNDSQEFIEDFKSFVTPVLAVSSDSRNLTSQWYSIHGQRLLTPPTKNGIYIRNGKKVTVK